MYTVTLYFYKDLSSNLLQIYSYSDIIKVNLSDYSEYCKQCLFDGIHTVLSVNSCHIHRLVEGSFNFLKNIFIKILKANV